NPLVWPALGVNWTIRSWGSRDVPVSIFCVSTTQPSAAAASSAPSSSPSSSLERAGRWREKNGVDLRHELFELRLIVGRLARIASQPSIASNRDRGLLAAL